MCDRAKYESLDRRVDKLEQDVAVIKSNQDSMHEEMRQGFIDLKQINANLYAEKAKWGEWARASMNSIGKWLAKWGTVILLASLGAAWGMSWAKEFVKN